MRPNAASQDLNVTVLNVSAVSAEMNGNSLGARQLAQDRCRYGIGFIRLPRLPDRRNMIDVDR
jgi:hypothetical protein